MLEKSGARKVFVSGASGYLGRTLISELLFRGHEPRALVRASSIRKLPAGCVFVVGNALDNSSYMGQVHPADTFVHLVGVSHPGPSKTKQFHTIDLASVGQAVPAARAAGVSHFVYVSVAQPAPVMKAYVKVRAECEAVIGSSGLNATILRPWYILGPGHRWPCLLFPAYWIVERLPATRDTALRLGLVTLQQMTSALAWAVENPSQGVRILDVPQIRRFGSA